MKHTLLWLAWAAAITWTTGTRAADAPPTLVMRDFTDIVSPPDQNAYEAGIKSYNQCLAQHGFKYTWTAWVHETGDTYAYSYTTDPLPWSEYDAMQAAAKACDSTSRSSINPRLKSETSAFMEVHPELSHLPKSPGSNQPLIDMTHFIEVIYFKLKPGHQAHETFVSVAKKIADAAEKSKWPNYYAINEIRDGGSDAPDFIVVIPSASWAELGKEPATPLWTMMESVYGKADAAATRKSFNDALQDESAHIDSYSAELSYKATGK
ncbi:hypothetical protein [Dyella sp. C9]|uniref:hypothetical protein n=1 Tax=Dyella sp. C9 TaxID=2202154 RepID=UPI000DEF180D|nr:hypothetical protein [Dyella sp. C9]